MVDPPPSLDELRGDLAAEHDALDAMVSGLDVDEWQRPTPSPRWSVRDQIGHLTYFDETATVALTAPADFPAKVDELFGLLDGDPTTIETRMDELTLAPARQGGPDDVLRSWRAARSALVAASAATADDARIPWYGPAMSHRSFLTARLMETWAHGTDIADTIGAPVQETMRLRHIVRLGVATRGWSYLNRGQEVPDGTVGVRLNGPDGGVWEIASDGANEVVRGSAVDFALVVTQRRHLDDTDLVAGPLARDWLERAQAFAGPASDGPPPGRRR